MFDNKKVVLAHHWLTGIRGGEKVLEQFSRLYPESEILTLVKDDACWPAWLRKHKVRTSIMQRVPGAEGKFKMLLPFFPMIIGGSLRASRSAELILSTDASMIKGLGKAKDTMHICYCHSPPRYLWDMQKTYLEQSSEIGLIGRLAFKLVTPYLRVFDKRSARKVDRFIANSKFVAERIRRCYGRDSDVIYPPVAVDEFEYQENKDDFYLVVSELVPYKRIDIAVEAFNRNGKRLVIIGHGPEMQKLKAMAKDNVTFLGRQPFDVLVDHYARARAFIFPGIEDFGITPLEAQASGTPVIAFGAGGALETVLEGRTGTFFHQQTADALCESIVHFENEMQIDSISCLANAYLFREERFREEITRFLGICYASRNNAELRTVAFPEFRLAQ